MFDDLSRQYINNFERRISIISNNIKNNTIIGDIDTIFEENGDYKERLDNCIQPIIGDDYFKDIYIKTTDSIPIESSRMGYIFSKSIPFSFDKRIDNDGFFNDRIGHIELIKNMNLKNVLLTIDYFDNGQLFIHNLDNNETSLFFNYLDTIYSFKIKSIPLYKLNETDFQMVVNHDILCSIKNHNINVSYDFLLNIQHDDIKNNPHNDFFMNIFVTILINNLKLKFENYNDNYMVKQLSMSEEEFDFFKHSYENISCFLIKIYLSLYNSHDPGNCIVKIRKME